jgi:hypothetical protein
VLNELVNETWNTRISTTPDKDGKVAFRGFFGKYTVRLTTKDGKVHTYNLRVRKDEQNNWVFTVGD